MLNKKIYERGFTMLQHFQYKSMYDNVQLPGWTFSFFFKNKRYRGEYLPDGAINWLSERPPEEDKVTKLIHDLMTFHVYE